MLHYRNLSIYNTIVIKQCSKSSSIVKYISYIHQYIYTRKTYIAKWQQRHSLLCVHGLATTYTVCVSVDSTSFVIYPELEATEERFSFLKRGTSVAFISGQIMRLVKSNETHCTVYSRALTGLAGWQLFSSSRRRKWSLTRQ